MTMDIEECVFLFNSNLTIMKGTACKTFNQLQTHSDNRSISLGDEERCKGYRDAERCYRHTQTPLLTCDDSTNFTDSLIFFYD